VARTSPRWLVRAGIAVVLVVSTVMWVYAFLIADEKPTDQLRDGSFATAAGTVCTRAKDEIRTSNLIGVEAKTPQQRADVTDQVDTILRTMVERLRPLVPGDASDAKVVTLWLNDWGQYLSDRDAWVTKLRAGEDAPFLEHQREGGEPASKAMDAFAVANDLTDCKVPDNY